MSSSLGGDLHRYIAQHRPDLATCVIHWTKETFQQVPPHDAKEGVIDAFDLLTVRDKNAFEVLQLILTERRIRANRPYTIQGSVPVVCFSETPLRIMANVFKAAGFDRKSSAFTNQAVGQFLNYRPYGLVFRKYDIYTRYDGRPVLYLRNDEPPWIKGYDKWRVHRFENPGTTNPTDWTHEREWRTPHDVDFSNLPPEDGPIVVVSETSEKELICETFRSATGSQLWKVVALSEQQ